MARRLIGLDVGTNAVTIAEVTPGSPPRLDMFAQVALARSAMREGEIADEAAVTDAVTRLRTEVGIKKLPVRVGIASPRVVVRQVEMPVMTRDELASALQFQAGDLIPIPIDEAVLDFAILGTSPSGGENGEPTMQVLLAAAYQATVMRLVSAVEAGGLSVAAVDLVPLALTRALARPVPVLSSVGAAEGGLVDEAPGAEGIVSFGGGVTSIAVHESGIPQFVRVIGSGGRELTDCDRDGSRRSGRDGRGLEASARRRPATTSWSHGRGRRWIVRSRCCSTKCGARSTTTATSRARRDCCGWSRPAGLRNSRDCPNVCRRWSACRSSTRPCTTCCASATSVFRPTSCRASSRIFRPRSGSRSAVPASARSSTCLPRARAARPAKARPQFDKRVLLRRSRGGCGVGRRHVSRAAEGFEREVEAGRGRVDGYEAPEQAHAIAACSPGAAERPPTLQAEALALLQSNVGVAAFGRRMSARRSRRASGSRRSKASTPLAAAPVGGCGADERGRRAGVDGAQRRRGRKRAREHGGGEARASDAVSGSAHRRVGASQSCGPLTGSRSRWPASRRRSRTLRSSSTT